MTEVKLKIGAKLYLIGKYEGQPKKLTKNELVNNKSIPRNAIAGYTIWSDKEGLGEDLIVTKSQNTLKIIGRALEMQGDGADEGELFTDSFTILKVISFSSNTQFIKNK